LREVEKTKNKMKQTKQNNERGKKAHKKIKKE
jgi:hypothetical protein